MVFDPKYIADHKVICIVNKSVVILQTPDGKEKRCNIHNLKPINTSQAFTLAFRDFQESVTQHRREMKQGMCGYNLRERT